MSHSLTQDELSTLSNALGRTPTSTELGIVSALWSEHCSYKSSRALLSQLPTQGDRVLLGPGENAGVVDIGEGHAAVFKIESHNHPSFIEPYQGAATGVGGILRDIFTMGARPIALLNALRFGAQTHPRTRHLVRGVVSGIGDYGNCTGVPTVGGETGFDPGYNGNILVNAMCVGLAHRHKIFRAAASGEGNLVFYVGARTGRDGIHGATMASAAFDHQVEQKKPTVQIGDPFTEKLLIEACLELMEREAIVAIQDMGAAGLASAATEMASQGGVGIELYTDKVPCREANMTPYDIMLSESQERMLMVLCPEAQEEAQNIFQKWELEVALIGRITNTKHLVVRHNTRTEAEIPLETLSACPPPVRQARKPSKPPPFPKTLPSVALSTQDVLQRLMSSLALCSRRWIWEQYDHMVMADTLQPPGGDAAVVRVHGTHKALALTVDTTPRYCAADPFLGAQQAIAEARRNLICTGATPIAITNCLNFGNPENPEVMGQFTATIQGMKSACQAFGLPVVSGNVSFYNETQGQPIPPTPTIGALGLLPHVSTMTTLAFKNVGEDILLVGTNNKALATSLYAHQILNIHTGTPPQVNLEEEHRHGLFVLSQIASQTLSAVHDLSDGGLLVGIAEMALAGDIGASLTLASVDHPFLFGEDQARYLLTCPPAATAQILAKAHTQDIPIALIGRTQEKYLTLDGDNLISLEVLKKAYEEALPTWIRGGL